MEALIDQPGDRVARPSRRYAWMGAAIGVASALTFAATLREGQSWGDDFAMYIAHARNLAEGRPYAETGFAPMPLHSYSPWAYPPGTPLMLAPVRFLLPVLPWFCLWMVRGAVELARWNSAAHRARWAVAAALALGLGQAGLGYASRPWSDDWLLADGVTSADARRAFETVRRHVAAHERFAVSRARAFALFTGRPTTIFPALDDTTPLAARHQLLTTWARRSGIRILAIGVRTNGYDIEEFQYQLRDLVAAYPQHYEPLVVDESFGLYHIR